MALLIAPIGSSSYVWNVLLKPFNSPTHKRTEGRAPVWGSEFTSKDATPQGGYSRNRCCAELKIVGFGGYVVVTDWW
jgi:hypothetical protein